MHLLAQVSRHEQFKEWPHLERIVLDVCIYECVCVLCTHACMSGCMCVCTCSPRYPGIRNSKRDHTPSASFWMYAPMNVCVCVCVYTCRYVGLYVCTHLLAQVSRHEQFKEWPHLERIVLDVCIYECVCALYTCMHVWMHVCMHLLAQVSQHQKVQEGPHLERVCMCVCVYTCIYVSMHVHVRVYMHICNFACLYAPARPDIPASESRRESTFPHVCVRGFMHICIYECGCVYTCMHVCS